MIVHSKILRLLALIVALGLVVAACAPEEDVAAPDDPEPAPEEEAPEDEETPDDEPAEEATPEEPEELIPVRWAAVVGASQYYLPHLLIEQGIAERHGFDVEIVEQAQAGAQFLALRTEETDLATGSWLDLHIHRSEGLEAKGFGSFLRYNMPMVTLADSDLEGPEDVTGRAFGTPRATLLDFLVMRTAMSRAYGIDPGVDAELIEGAPGLLVENLRNGDADAIITFSNLLWSPIHTGEFRVLTDQPELMEAAGLNRDAFYLLYIVHEGWLNEYPHAVDSLFVMIEEGLDLMMTDDDLFPELAEMSNVDEEIYDLFIEDTRWSMDTAYDESLIADTQELLDAMVEVLGSEILGDITEVDPDAFIFR